ncbi:MAG TPA: MarR family transcriptional regulator [Castellaniella sp.]|uniref:MarR family winged helix-turn-helix transcriptional regulator n=1 Tax=Castellaniella sp. TaxID=1955812 RepID=UPI002F08099B
MQAPLIPPEHTTQSGFYSSDPGDLGPDHNVGLLLKHLHMLLHRVMDHKACPLGLTAYQWRPLLLIHHKGIDTPAELARALNIDTGAVTRALDRLEAKGFLQRERACDDRRVVKIVLTDEGHRVTSRILPLIADTLNLHLQGFSEDEFRMLLSLLKRMIANGEHYFDAQPGDKK